MRYPSITIQGPILSVDLLERLDGEGVKGQNAADFGLAPGARVKDEIATAWSMALQQWRIFSRQREKVEAKEGRGTTETRTYWMLPLFGLLGYAPEIAAAETVGEKSYAVSHRDAALSEFPLHILGFTESLDRKGEHRSLSPHAMVQEYLNLKEEYLYALVSNGLSLRLLRDSSRLIKLSYIEFNLQQLFEEELFADFAVLYRLLHATRMPRDTADPAACLLEAYHQDALEDGSRIRDNLALAVEASLLALGEGFLREGANTALRERLESGEVDGPAYGHALLLLVYRMLFLMVLEERDLVYPRGAETRRRNIYYKYYSLGRLRRLSALPSVSGPMRTDLWQSLLATFRLFAAGDAGAPLGISPLGGELFDPAGTHPLEGCVLPNRVLLDCLARLDTFRDARTGQLVRVNYGSLDVEEFGSVYECLLEKAPVVEKRAGAWSFRYHAGEERSRSGSHYTPEELVKPLIRHSLDYVIEEKLKTIPAEREGALLSITVCDPACGSGHVLLNAARRIALELARVREGAEQPSPDSYRHALKDTIRRCIYGVDKNPAAVELCKIALWLESHNPGEPLSFLDHRIKCGDSLVGAVNIDDIKQPVPDAAFKKWGEEDAAAMKEIRARNKAELKQREKETDTEQTFEYYSERDIVTAMAGWENMPESTPEEVSAKKAAYEEKLHGPNWTFMRDLANLIPAQFFLDRKSQPGMMTTDATYRRAQRVEFAFKGNMHIEAARECARERRFFHWFLEFPEVFAAGGFDCVLGNPPYLGGKKISGALGDDYFNYLISNYINAGGQSDLIVYFLRNLYKIIKEKRFVSILSTNTVSEGETREAGLKQIVHSGSSIVFAIRSMKWPGIAVLEVALLSFYKGDWDKVCYLNGKKVDCINSFFLAGEEEKQIYPLAQNLGKIYKGAFFLGDGFIISDDQEKMMLQSDDKYNQIIFPYLNGDDLTEDVQFSARRKVINFFDWEEDEAKKYPIAYEYIRKKAYPLARALPQKNSTNIRRIKYWWQYADRAPSLSNKLFKTTNVYACTIMSKYLNFIEQSSNQVFSNSLGVIVSFANELFFILQSSFHHEWSRKYGSTMKTDLRYTLGGCFQCFPFVSSYSAEMREKIQNSCNDFKEHRRKVAKVGQIGLTDIYNIFHKNNFDRVGSVDQKIAERIVNLKSSAHTKRIIEIFNAFFPLIEKLRSLHVEIDNLVLAAYGWDKAGPDGPAIDLAHDFYEVDYLPENDHVRYTISPAARKEVLKRLLLLNHKIHAEEVAAGLVDESGKVLKQGMVKTGKATPGKRGRKPKEEPGQGTLL